MRNWNSDTKRVNLYAKHQIAANSNSDASVGNCKATVIWTGVEVL